MTACKPVPKEHRRRDCRDRVRHAQHRLRRRGDPASAVAAQLLALVLLLVGGAPLVPAPHPAPVPTTARRVQRRDDWSPAQEQREHGEGGRFPVRPSAAASTVGHGRYLAWPSYRRLVADLRRPTARAEAFDVLRRRLSLPPEAAGWLDEMADARDWSALAACARPGVPDEQVEEAMLRAAVGWTEARIQPVAGPPDNDNRMDGPRKP